MSTLRQLITTYRKGFEKEANFGKMNAASNKSRFIATKYQKDTEKILKWIHSISIVCVFILGAVRVTQDSNYLADFVTINSTMFKYDAVITDIFKQLFNTINGYASVQKISELLNAPTRRKALLKARERRQRILSELKDADENFSFDPACISVYKVEFNYALAQANEMPAFAVKDKTGDKETDNLLQIQESKATVGPITMVIEQGQIVCIHSGASAGKKTFLQLLGRSLLPTQGIVWYPDNLRVRLIPGDPLLFNGTLMENLKFGNQKQHTEEEIWECCRLVGVEEELVGRSDFPVGHNGQKLSLSNRLYICLARALLSSVDLLLISNTLDVLGNEDSTAFVGLLKKWRDNRGMPCLSQDSPAGVDVSLLKKKTVFYVTKNVALETVADAVMSLRRDEASNKFQSR